MWLSKRSEIVGLNRKILKGHHVLVKDKVCVVHHVFNEAKRVYENFLDRDGKFISTGGIFNDGTKIYYGRFDGYEKPEISVNRIHHGKILENTNIYVGLDYKELNGE